MHLRAVQRPRNARSKRLGHSDNLALLQRASTRTHIRCIRASSMIVGAEGEAHKGDFQAAIWFNIRDVGPMPIIVPLPSLFAAGQSRTRPSSRFRFTFFTTPWKPRIDAESIRNCVEHWTWPFSPSSPRILTRQSDWKTRDYLLRNNDYRVRRTPLISNAQPARFYDIRE